MIVRNLTAGRALGDQVRRADSFRLRLLGLMFRPRLAPGEGLLIQPCQQVHTHFMRFPIDVLFVDEAMRVVHIIRAMKPWGFSPLVREARSVLELPADAATEVALGDQLRVE